jgi:hypothetical protein
MPVDPEYLCQHYASLSDEALAAIDRDDLVEQARRYYDDEVGRRKLTKSRDAVPSDAPREDARVEDDRPATEDEPDWLEEAAEVCSYAVFAGTAPPETAVDARDALEAAGIPCHLELFETAEEKSTAPEQTLRWRLMVPGKLSQRATSVLDRDIFNPEFEAEWKAHLEELSDEELREMSPQIVFCGLFDRIERVTRAYEEEISRRKIRARSA